MKPNVKTVDSTHVSIIAGEPATTVQTDVTAADASDTCALPEITNVQEILITHAPATPGLRQTIVPTDVI